MIEQLAETHRQHLAQHLNTLCPDGYRCTVEATTDPDLASITLYNNITGEIEEGSRIPIDDGDDLVIRRVRAWLDALGVDPR